MGGYGCSTRRAVIRELQGDIIILLGGRTGRDGCGGAAGSSRTTEDLSNMWCRSTEGNAPTEERFRECSSEELVNYQECNDFGAGGVCCIGELADGLHVFLDKVPKIYGSDGTEIDSEHRKNGSY